MRKILSSGIFLILTCSMPLHTFAQEPVVKTRATFNQRLAIYLTPTEREYVLAEMRAFLESTQKIVHGVSEGDMKLVAKSARQSGRAAQTGAPKSLAEKLPAAFKQLGAATHQQFDTLALDAEQLGDEEHALSQLSELLTNCVSCHAAFRIEAQ